MPIPRWWFAAFVLSSGLVALVSLRSLIAPLEMVMPNMAHFQTEMPLALWGHILFGPLALVLAPFQLSARLRARRPVLHRWIGRTYGLAVLVAGLSSLTLAPGSIASSFARTGFLVQSVLWIGLTAAGVALALRRDFASHRVWMLRSVALTFTAVTLRLAMGALVAAGWTPEQTYDVTAWGAWIFNLAVLEFWLRARRPALA